MIPRYTREEMGRVWSDANKYQRWLDVELAAVEDALATHPRRDPAVADTDPAETERVWRTHAFASWMCSKLVIPSMRTRPRGDIVMISSAAVVHMAANSAPYNMAKAALEALAWSLAREERRNGIHVNVVAPGLVDTEMGRRLVKGAMGVEDIRTIVECSPQLGHTDVSSKRCRQYTQR